MPFNIQIIDKRDDSRSLLEHDGEIVVYARGADAAEIVDRRKRLYSEVMPWFSYRIIKIEDKSDESDDWKIREKERFANGQYDRIPWHLESWSLASLLDENHNTAFHFPHMSKDKTGMIAFTESSEKGRDDIQKRMRPGKYLTQFFYYSLTSNEIRSWAGKVSLLSGESQEYTIAMTPDDIESVYVNGPPSCMGKSADEFQSREHPTRMYGAGDLGIAYISREDSIAARVLVWPDKKIWGRVYGDGGVYQDQLKELLAADGYEHGNCSKQWKGARLLLVEQRDGFIAPYLDIGGGCLTEAGEYLEISYHGEIDAESESGLTGPRDTCDYCGDAYDAESDGGSVDDHSYCQSCYEEYAVCCEDCGNTIHRDNAVYLEHIERELCDSCASDYPMCDSCGEQFSEKHMNHVSATNDDVCDSCYSDNYIECTACNEPDENGNMETDDSGGSLCESCHDERVEKGETSSNRVENENQNEISFLKVV